MTHQPSTRPAEPRTAAGDCAFVLGLLFKHLDEQAAIEREKMLARDPLRQPRGIIGVTATLWEHQLREQIVDSLNRYEAEAAAPAGSLDVALHDYLHNEGVWSAQREDDEDEDWHWRVCEGAARLLAAPPTPDIPCWHCERPYVHDG